MIFVLYTCTHINQSPQVRFFIQNRLNPMIFSALNMDRNFREYWREFYDEPLLQNRTIVAIEIGYPCSSPKPLVEGTLHIVRHELGPTKRTSFPIEVHPAVQTVPMKNVPTVRQPPDFLVTLELVQTDGAILRRFGLAAGNQVRKFHYG